ncbi:MAG: MBL fold metallo-hydrolase [Acidobacteria bacterium]|nr:MBL fold metallo-hydrolase [Acidobacteriota bacterium]
MRWDTSGVDGVALWWLGQSGYLVYSAGEWLCFDPYLSDSLTRKYANTPKPHVRMKPIVAAPSELTFVDVATSTHNHTDHLDAETLHGIAPKKLVIPEANRAFVCDRLGCAKDWPLGMRIGETRPVGGFDFTAVPAAHESLTPETIGYVVRTNGVTIYHSGDTLLYESQAPLLRGFDVDIAILPINGKVGNMNHAEAAWLGKAIGAKVTIPCHYDMFEFNTADPAGFAAEAARLGTPHRILSLGERFVYSPNRKENDSPAA